MMIAIVCINLDFLIHVILDIVGIVGDHSPGLRQPQEPEAWEEGEGRECEARGSS